MGLLQNLIINLRVRNSGLHQGLKQSEAAMMSFRDSVVRNIAGPLAAAFSVKKIYQFVREAQKAAQEISAMSERLGFSPGMAERLDYGLKRKNFSGISELRGVIGSITENRRAALAGDDMLLQGFGQLGISTQQIQSMNPQQLFIAALTESFRRKGKFSPDALAQLRRIGGESFPEILKSLGKEGRLLSPSVTKEAGVIEELASQGDVIDDAFTSASNASQNAYVRTSKSLRRGGSAIRENPSLLVVPTELRQINSNLAELIRLGRETQRTEAQAMLLEQILRQKSRQPFN